MLSSSSRSSQAAKPRRFDSRRTNALATPRSHGPAHHREDKNMNAITATSSSPRRVTKAPPVAARTKAGTQPRPQPPVIQSRFAAQKAATAVSKLTKPKPRVGRVTSTSAAATKKVAPPSAANASPPAPAPPPPPPSALPLDPNCNEPSLPCLCCDGRSPQDSNSLFNHNHNNNNTVSLRQQMQLPPPPPPVLLPPRKDDNVCNGAAEKQQQQSQLSQQTSQTETPGCLAANLEDQSENQREDVRLDNKKKKNDQVVEEEEEEEEEEDDEEEEEEESSSGDIDIDDDEDEEEADNDDDDEDDDDDDDEEDDDTLVPSCCDCPPSLLDFSLTSSTSSSSTSISSCSDLESDCADASPSVSLSSPGRDRLSLTLTSEAPECCKPPARSPPSLPSLPTLQPCSPDEGYPSALGSPSPDYLGVKGDSDVTKLGLLDFLESVGEFGKMERFSQVIQVARWDLEGEQHWDVLRDRLDHLDRLEKVNREVKLTYVARLHEQGLDLGELEEQDLGDVLDEMGNIDLSWKLYCSTGAGGGSMSMGDSQEFSDAGVDLSDDPLLPDSLTPSPVEPPPRPPARPPKPPARHASVTSDLHTYINISRETTSVALQASPTLTTFSPNSSFSTFSTFRCEKPLPPSPPPPPSVPPLPMSKPLPYLSLYTTPSPPPSLPAPTPPIPPPRRRHLARKEAQRLAALQAEQEKTPLSLPPPTTRPPPLPPPPVISVTSSRPALPPPPSFHALDVEIRKLLVLAGVTQAELLKLSPELGVCVGGLEGEEEEEEEEDLSQARTQEFRLHATEDEEVKQYEAELSMARGQRLSRLDGDGDVREDPVGGMKKSEEAQRTTSFSEMARRRRRTSAVPPESYYSPAHSNTHQSKAESFESYSPPPPPPPPRPLPPVPPSLPPSKVSTLPANSAQPERFDWLIAFTPDGEAPPPTVQPPLPPVQAPPPPQSNRKAQAKVPKSLPGSSGSSSPSSAPKVTTTFKELRLRNKSASPPTKITTDPEPDPTIITPDPDILYNLRWRREKAGGDGSQWEYTSQAQALFMQQPPPPALTSMAALKEMLQRADKEGGRLELCPSQRIGCSLSENSLWMTGREWECQGDRGDDQEGRKETDEVEVRGRADGGRTLESRTSVSSPSLSLAQPPPQPYFLHSAAPPHRPPGPPGPPTSRPLEDPRPRSNAGDGGSLALAELSPAPCYDSLADSPFVDGDALNTEGDVTSNSMCNLDSLYSSGGLEEQHGARLEVDTPFSGRFGGGLDCATPYKNMDVVMTCSAAVPPHLEAPTRARLYKELPPLPSYYLHHPKNCPLHRGAPPRLSPIGALSPPRRSGAPPCGATGSHLSSPLFPRSHTLPALAAPLYYPGLYSPLPPSAPPLPPKLHQAPAQSHVATVRSVSFAGAVRKEEVSWMGDDLKRPAGGLGPSSLCLQEKKVLVSAVSVAVEAILAQFSSSRTVVQKALSGDSAINPSLGRLVLQCLCPALHNLLVDGLKPHQSDLIAGRRPNSAWALVQASTAPSPKTQVLFNLQVRVAELPQLRQSKYRFNAFLFGLLNTKCLDFWLSHLLSCNDVLESFYRADSFMRLSLSACRPQFEELLLVLQPLSLLTFNLDLLFQHHHFEAEGHAPPCRVAAAAAAATLQPSQLEAPRSRYLESLSAVDFRQPPASAQENQPPQAHRQNEEPVPAPRVVAQTSPQLLWVQDAEIAALPPPNAEEDSLAQQAGQVIQQGWGAVLRWSGKLSQNLAELAARKEEMKADLHHLQAGSDFAPVSSGAQVPWALGRLFGAPKSPNSPQGHSLPTRRPSQWLAPSVNALTRMVSGGGGGSAAALRSIPELRLDAEPQSEKEANSLEEEKEVKEENGRALRSVRTLCDHAGTGSQLTFCKGEELLVLGGVDGDWIRCRQGEREGLVPIGYTSLIM